MIDADICVQAPFGDCGMVRVALDWGIDILVQDWYRIGRLTWIGDRLANW